MARARSLLSVCAHALFVVACRPEHNPAPITPAPPSVEHEPRARTSALKVAVFDPESHGNWGNLALSPAPASLVAPCLDAGAAGWISVNVDLHDEEASMTSVAEASSDVALSTRTCIANALTGTHLKGVTMRVLVYVTFSPE